jgi:hypothetical protein
MVVRRRIFGYGRQNSKGTGALRNHISVLLLFFVALTSSVCFAKKPCEKLLEDLRLPGWATSAQQKYNLTPREFSGILTAAADKYIDSDRDEHDHFVFHNVGARMDVAFRVRFMHRRNGATALAHFSRASKEEETSYFSYVARMENLTPLTMHLFSPVLGVTEVIVQPSRIVKLDEKHAVSIDDVYEAFDNVMEEISAIPNAEKYRWPRYHFYGRTKDRRVLRVILEKANGKVYLVSAFEPDH